MGPGRPETPPEHITAAQAQESSILHLSSKLNGVLDQLLPVNLVLKQPSALGLAQSIQPWRAPQQAVQAVGAGAEAVESRIEQLEQACLRQMHAVPTPADLRTHVGLCCRPSSPHTKQELPAMRRGCSCSKRWACVCSLGGSIRRVVRSRHPGCSQAVSSTVSARASEHEARLQALEKVRMQGPLAAGLLAVIITAAHAGGHRQV